MWLLFATLKAIFVELCGMDRDDDGLVFDSNSIRLDEIKLKTFTTESE